jgi:hypothetical protein
MAEPRDITFREQWWEQILDDPEVVEGLLAAALDISTAARRDGTRALMSRRRLAETLGVSEAMAKRRTWRLQKPGYLQLVEQGRWRGDGTVTANVYDLSLRVTQMTHRDESQQVTQVTPREFSMVKTASLRVTQVTYPSLIPP